MSKENNKALMELPAGSSKESGFTPSVSKNSSNNEQNPMNMAFAEGSSISVSKSSANNEQNPTNMAFAEGSRRAVSKSSANNEQNLTNIAFAEGSTCDVSKNSSSNPQNPTNKAVAEGSSLAMSFRKASEVFRESKLNCPKQELEISVNLVHSDSVAGPSKKRKRCNEVSLDLFARYGKPGDFHQKMAGLLVKRKTRSSCCDAAYHNKFPLYDFTKDLVALESSKHDEPENSGSSSSDTDNAEIEDEENSANGQKSPGSMKRDSTYYFGLFGMTNKCDDDVQPNYFNWLPPPIIENILCHIPFLDLIGYRLVCKSWNSIIDSDKFMEWKKAYYLLKLNDTEAECLKQVLAAGSFAEVKDCLPSLITFMNSQFMQRAVPEVPSLKQVPNYQLALDVFAEKFPDIELTRISVWGIVAMLVILAETTEETDAVLQCLIHDRSPLSICDVLNAFYCITTFFLHFMKNLNMNRGVHYRLYHILHTFENTTPRRLSCNVECLRVKPTTGQQSMRRYCQPLEQKLTFEQLRILNHRLRPNDVVRIIAFAGTGKTTVLLHYAKLYPNLKFLNVVFNKSASSNASKIFPPNVECRTAHSLAYQAIGKQYRHKLRSKLKPHDIVLHIDKSQSERYYHVFTFAKMVLETIHNFCSSPDEEIQLIHVPKQMRTIGSPPFLASCETSEIMCEAIQLAIKRESEELWKKMCDKDNAKVGIVHDTYLKLYQLSHPKYSGYDCIMIDEAQDSDAAMLDIMLSQNLPVILVGDPNQQIYAFRGAKNSLQEIKANYTYHLTKSFRFGPEIAYVASCCIETLKGNFRDTIVGSNKPSFTDGKVEGQYAIIARTNLQLFEEALRLCCSDNRRPGEPPVIQGAFVGGISSYGLDELVDIYNMSISGHVKNKLVKKFETLEDLAHYARKTNDTGLLGKVDMVMHRREQIPLMVTAIKRRCSYPLELANVVFSTAHKAKGLEFDTVLLAKDFDVGEVFTQKTKPSSLEEEFNILYVALTRAKKSLILSEVLLKVMIASQEKYEFLKSLKQITSSSNHLVCIDCKRPCPSTASLILYQREFTLASGYKQDGGPKCMRCACRSVFRPQIIRGPARMLLDPVDDNHHRSLSRFVENSDEVARINILDGLEVRTPEVYVVLHRHPR